MDDPNDVAESAIAAAGSKYSLVGAIIARAHQLTLGYPPRIEGVDAISVEKPAMLALREIAAGAVEIAVAEQVSRDEKISSRA